MVNRRLIPMRQSAEIPSVWARLPQNYRNAGRGVPTTPQHCGAPITFRRRLEQHDTAPKPTHQLFVAQPATDKGPPHLVVVCWPFT
jgi:hypothetical protein